MSPLFIHRAPWLKTAFEPDPIRTLFLSKRGNPAGNAQKEGKPAANTQPGKSRRPRIRPGCLQQATEHAPPLGRIPAGTVLNNKHGFRQETPSESRKPFPLQFKRLLRFSTAQNVPGLSQGSPGRGREQPWSRGACQAFPVHLGDGGGSDGTCSGAASPAWSWALAAAAGVAPGDTGTAHVPCKHPCAEGGDITGGGKGGHCQGWGGHERDDSLSLAARRTPKAREEQGQGAAEGCPLPFRRPEACQVCLLGEEAKPSR